jgi:hypothetical protein
MRFVPARKAAHTRNTAMKRPKKRNTRALDGHKNQDCPVAVGGQKMDQVRSSLS